MDRLASLLLYKTWIVLAFAGALIALELAFPAVRPLARVHLETLARRAARWTKNISFLAINAALSPLIVIPVSAAAAQWAPHWRPDWWAGGTGLALDLLILDCWIYWWHRANHELPFLWRFHEVHHLDEFLDATTAVRFHFGEVLLSAAIRALAIFILAAPLTSVVVFETLVLLSTLFHHSNVRVPQRLERILLLFVVTPAIHWVHHHAVRADTDSNYSTILSLWDKLFGSRSRTVRHASMPIGVEGGNDRGIVELILRPFRG